MDTFPLSSLSIRMHKGFCLFLLWCAESLWGSQGPELLIASLKFSAVVNQGRWERQRPWSGLLWRADISKWKCTPSRDFILVRQTNSRMIAGHFS